MFYTESTVTKGQWQHHSHGRVSVTLDPLASNHLSTKGSLKQPFVPLFLAHYRDKLDHSFFLVTTQHDH